MQRFDERDTLFSRMKLEPGTRRHEDYYNQHPELQEIDRRLREAPPGVFADRQTEQARIAADFRLIKQLRPLVDGPVTGEKAGIDPEVATGELKKITAEEDVVACGVVLTPLEHAYSVRGRGEYYGRSVDRVLPFTLIYGMQMDYGATMKAPAPEEAVEVAAVYLRLALLGLKLAFLIRSLGYQSLTHMDGRSQLILPPVAEKAGLGSIGRHGLLVHPRVGSRIRLGAVTTELPLLPDGPGSFNITSFCERCGRCAELCPMGAIPGGDPGEQPEGRWRTNHEACFRGWKEFGTDCGVCLAVCPYSSPAGEAGPAKPGSPAFLKQYLFGRRPDTFESEEEL